MRYYFPITDDLGIYEDRQGCECLNPGEAMRSRPS